MKEIKDVNEQKDILFSCIGRFNIVKTVISKLVYRFNVISIESEKKNRGKTCVGIDKLILKFILQKINKQKPSIN